MQNIILNSRKDGLLSTAQEAVQPSRATGLVSIVILTFNQIRFTQECVASIQACTPEPHEIIFVDNGSTDGTVEWLKEQLQGNAGYRLIENGTNFGFAKGCNQGIEAAQGEFVLLLNNDVVVTSEWLEGMLECLHREPNSGIIGPMTNNISGIQRVKRIGYDDMSGLDRYAALFRQTNRYRRIENRRIVGFCMLFRHELTDRIGLLDESFGSGNFEDDDYCLRAELAGYRNLIAGDVFIHHYGSQTFSGNNINYNDAMMCNMALYRNKWNYGKLDETTLRRLLPLDAVREARRLNMAGKVDAAVELLIQKGIRSAPDNPEPYHELAVILMAAGRYAEALQVVPEMPVDTDQTLIGEVEAVCHAALGNDDAAYNSSRKAYGSSRALVVQGTLAARRGDLAGAEELVRLSIEADPGCGTAWLSLGMLLWGRGKQEDAWQAIKRSVVVNPLNGEAVAILLDLGGRLGRLSEVVEVLEQAWDIFPDSLALGRAYAGLLAAVGRDADAVAVYETLLVTSGADNELLDEAVSVRKRIGPVDQVGVQGPQSVSLCMIVKNEEKNLPGCLASLKPVVDEIVVVDTGSTDRTADIAELFGARVYSFNWTGNFSDARNLSLEKACGNWLLVMDADEVLSPQDYELVRQTVRGSSGKKVCWSVMTRNYTGLHPQGWVANDGSYPREERAEGWHPSRKVRLFPNDPQVRFVGEVHEMIERTALAAGYQMREASFVVHHYGGLAADSSGDQSKKRFYFELGKQKLAEQPNDLPSIGELAVQASELELYEEAIELWNRFLHIAPDVPIALFNKGFALMNLNRFSEALDVTRRALEVEPFHKEAAFNYGTCALYAGDIHEAIQRLEQVLGKHPGHPPLMSILTVLSLAAGQAGKAQTLLQRLRQINYSITDYIDARVSVLQALGNQERSDLIISTMTQLSGGVHSTR